MPKSLIYLCRRASRASSYCSVPLFSMDRLRPGFPKVVSNVVRHSPFHYRHVLFSCTSCRIRCVQLQGNSNFEHIHNLRKALALATDYVRLPFGSFSLSTHKLIAWTLSCGDALRRVDRRMPTTTIIRRRMILCDCGLFVQLLTIDEAVSVSAGCCLSLLSFSSFL